jgi:putative DNA primase/helicase
VLSGGLTESGQARRHLYWRLVAAAEGPDVDRVCRVRRLLAEKVGADLSFGNPAQLIRVAGSIHAKGGGARRAEILHRTDAAYELCDIEAAVERMPVMPNLPVALRRKAPMTKELLTRRVRENGADGVSRHDALTRVIGHWLRLERLGSMSAHEAWAAVVDHNQALIQPPWREDHLRREFDAVRRLDRQNHLEPSETFNEHAAVVGPITEDSLARGFAAAQRDKLRHVDGQWLQWSGKVWKPCPRVTVVQSIRDFSALLARGRGLTDDKRLNSLRMFKAIEELARGDHRLQLSSAALDRSPMLLNTPSGIVDLGTGEVRPSDPGEHLSQMTAATPRGTCPRWTRFIDEVTQGDKELAAYLARVAGYCLTGDTREQVFFFLHGSGSNGKSTFVSVIAAVVGSYAKAAPSETFTASRLDRHPTELASLRGARLVTALEMDRGRAWNESRLKGLTGSEKLSARWMNGDFFEFAPVCKVIFAGNHLPRTRPDKAMQRRLQRIPFMAEFSGARRTKGIEAQLLEERDGILGWMIEGCIEWQKSGLAPPTAVADASRSYFEEADLIGRWLADRCSIEEGNRTKSRDLYSDYRSWAEQAGLAPLSEPEFVGDIKARGFKDYRTSAERGIQQLVLRGEDVDR